MSTQGIVLMAGALGPIANAKKLSQTRKWQAPGVKLRLAGLFLRQLSDCLPEHQTPSDAVSKKRPPASIQLSSEPCGTDTMATYLSSLLTHTTSRYNNLRRSLLSDESDGDTEEDSHISRVLRAYYVEKGRPFPPWLGPDPSAGQATSSLYSQPGARQQAQMASARRGGGLSDLWDSPAQPAPPQQPTSLRRGQSSATARTASPAPPPPATASSTNPRDRYNTADSYSSRPQRPHPSGARSMPGMQPAGNQAPGPDSARTSASGSLGSGPGSVSGGTAQDRLKAKLWGAGRSGSARDPL